jgi:formylmethanofuran dehydrogenase subunit B
MLVRGEADAMLVIASDPASNFAQPAIETMRRIPVIVLDPKFTHTAALARVAITTATYGINTGGTVYRMDDVPITLRPAFPSPYPGDEEVLLAIKKRLKELLKDKPVEVMPPPLRG